MNVLLAIIITVAVLSWGFWSGKVCPSEFIIPLCILNGVIGWFAGGFVASLFQ